MLCQNHFKGSRYRNKSGPDVLQFTPDAETRLWEYKLQLKLQLLNLVTSIIIRVGEVNFRGKCISRLPVFQQLLWPGSYIPYVQDDKASFVTLKVVCVPWWIEIRPAVLKTFTHSAWFFICHTLSFMPKQPNPSSLVRKCSTHYSDSLKYFILLQYKLSLLFFVKLDIHKQQRTFTTVSKIIRLAVNCGLAMFF